jgi:hypothetical protein
MNKLLFILVIIASITGYSAVNTWTVLPAYGGALQRYASGVTYLPDSNRFLLSMGSTSGATAPRYSEQVLSLKDSIWKNFFPAGKLGVWGSDTGASSAPGFSTPYFTMTDAQNNTRPNLGHWDGGNTFCQYAYNTDDKKIYYYLSSYVVRYDPNTRVWEVLTTPAALGTLSWGSLCYDAHNQEIVLFGGTCNISLGNPGTWIYKPATGTWTKLSLSTQPAARCGSPMVYDAKNQKIILFSGDHRDSMMTDTWIYDVASKTWSQKHPALSPKPRAGHAMVYLPKSQKVVMMGGFTQFSTFASNDAEYAKIDTFEIWTYDVSNGTEGAWSLVKHFSSANPVCIPGQQPYCLAAAADTADRIIAIGAGPNYYAFDAITYYLECDPSQIDVAGTQTYRGKTDSTAVRTQRSDPAWYKLDDASVDTAAQENALRSLPQNVWTLITPPKSPFPGKDYSTAVFAPEFDRLIRWGGGHATLCFNEMPEYSMSRNRWSIGYRPESSLESYRNGGGPSPTFAGRPTLPSHPYDNYDYCPILKKVVLWQSRTTWFYDVQKKDWDTLRLPVLSSMGGQLDYHRALNATPHGMVAWAPPSSDEWGAGRLWLLDTLTLTWKALTIKGTDAFPAVSDYSGMVYDGKRDRLIFARNDGAGQLWEYRFPDSTIAKLNPGNTGVVTSMGQPRECVYLPNEDEVVFLAGVTVGGRLGHLLYDCTANSWRNQPVTGAGGFQWQTSETGWALRYDLKRKLMILTTDANQIYMLNFRDTTKGTAAETAPDKAAKFSWQARPNPFTGAINFSVQGIAGKTSVLRIYDITGRLVADLSPKGRQQAVSRIQWYAGGQPSGIYIARLETGNKVYKKSLVLTK